MARRKRIKPRLKQESVEYCLGVARDIVDNQAYGRLTREAERYWKLKQLAGMIRYCQMYKYLSVGQGNYIKGVAEYIGLDFECDMSGFMPDGVTPYYDPEAVPES